ncbi:MAG: radical SAM protein [Elusimicrobia bacterium]|nr:radical SAM protein [Elusimicrobiota bacterium]
MSEPELRITWNMHWRCDYRCSYCFFAGHWEEYSRRFIERSTEEWLACWRRIRERHGRALLTITGGEPFIFPDFLNLISGLSDIHWPINISTNASVPWDGFIAAVDPKKVSVSVSFHPEYHEIGPFLGRLKGLRAAGFSGCNNFVAYPPQLKDLPRLAAAFQGIGESLKVIPFIGRFEGRTFPEGYTAEQRKLLGMSDDWVDNKRRKGRACLAGCRSALLLPDGSVTRCGQVGDPGIFGNICDPDFSLLPGPAPCDVELCPCDEWKVMPDEKAPDRAGAWLP